MTVTRNAVRRAWPTFVPLCTRDVRKLSIHELVSLRLCPAHVLSHFRSRQ